MNGTKQHRSIGPQICSLVWLLCDIPICFSKKLSISLVIKNKILKALQYVVDQFLTDLYKYLRYICNRWRMSFSNSPICKIWSSPHNELFSKLLNICQISLSFFLTFYIVIIMSRNSVFSYHYFWTYNGKKQWSIFGILHFQTCKWFY